MTLLTFSISRVYKIKIGLSVSVGSLKWKFWNYILWSKLNQKNIGDNCVYFFKNSTLYKFRSFAKKFFLLPFDLLFTAMSLMDRNKHSDK